MQMQVTGRHMPVTDPIRTYAEEKISKAAKIHDREDMVVDVVLHVEKNPSNKNHDVAEVTARMKGIVVRAEEAAPDMYSAIDLVSEKLERQMRRFKERLADRRPSRVSVKTVPGGAQVPTGVAVDEGHVVRKKVVEVKPMNEQDAILQMELLGHDFFLFTHAETGELSVLYRRQNGDYGVLEPHAA